MFKSLGLGICCLTLGISSVTHASILPIFDGKSGDNKCFQINPPCDTKVVDFKGIDLKDILKGILDKVGDKGGPLPTWNDKGVKNVCKVDFKHHEPLLCDIDFKHDKDHCDVLINHCDFDDHNRGCDPHAVPAPASAAFGGLGIAGIMAMVGLRSRRSVKA